MNSNNAENHADSSIPPFVVDIYSGKLTINSNSSHKQIRELLSFASRFNEKRQYMFASKVLGKYIPACPNEINSKQLELIEDLHLHDELTTFIGFAESACGLGEALFNKCLAKAPYLVDKSIYTHTTRQFNDDEETIIEFIEPHSHASDQVLLKPKDPDILFTLKNSTCLVVVEDEITTGKTLENFIAEFLKVNHTLRRLVILTFVDWRTSNQNMNLRNRFPELDIIEHSLLSGTIEFEQYKPNKTFNPKRPHVSNSQSDTCANISDAKYGIFKTDRKTALAVETVAAFTKHFDIPCMIVGTSEFTAWPQQVAKDIFDEGGDVLTISSTRAPLQIHNDIKSKTSFLSHYGDGEMHYIYNLCTHRKVFIAYDTFANAERHKDLLESLNATAIVLEAE
ncbi:phosphoribosyltransferase domain-containing protein [Pseudoalteromonas sp. OFAV1]|uniref:phosphoribosyltransferase domain-containing protein n=1 Tax=Pseudoalteromonas sp. OFAV1 TaxID=2908892 RepID=UPI001F37CEB8|nr:phosphoribosyltransferase domain-containing protein [Pseudoalteromonas sp. OFAV1]MCF2903192.1 phosphoribosyltransferase domain-containing protein [Pseudoalteromonas sp. OFAV1]